MHSPAGKITFVYNNSLSLSPNPVALQMYFAFPRDPVSLAAVLVELIPTVCYQVKLKRSGVRAPCVLFKVCV